MKSARSRSVAAAAILTFAAGVSAVETPTGFYGPTPYLSFADSPFSALTFDYFHLEDFESTTPTPGYASLGGGTIASPGPLTDSVDADADGINGSGAAGRSWFSAGTAPFFAFSFDAGVLGRLPTHAGLVWTDVGFVLPDPEFPAIPVTEGRVKVSFVAYGPGDTFLGSVQPGDPLGDGSATSATAEDRFFGVYSAGGISRIEMYALYSQDWEVDHLQYGALNPVPEPAQWLLMALGVAAVAGVAGRRAKKDAKKEDA